MSIINQFVYGLRHIASAFSFMQTHKLTRYYYVIFLLIIALFATGFWIANPLSLLVSEWINSLFNVTPDNSWLGYLALIASSMGRLLTWILTLIITCMLSSYLALIILSPLFSFLAEKTFTIITRTEIPFSFSRMLSNIFRSICIVIRNLFLQIIITVLLLLIGLLPMAGLPIAIAIGIVDAFFLGFSMTDYSMEIMQMNIGQSIKFANQNKGLIIGLGLPYSLTCKIPFFGLYLAILIAPLCVVGAAKALTEKTTEDSAIEKNNQNLQA